MCSFQVAEQLFLAGLFNNRTKSSSEPPTQTSASSAAHSRRYTGDSIRSSFSSARQRITFATPSSGPKTSNESSFSSRRTFNSAREPSEERNGTVKDTTASSDLELEAFPNPPRLFPERDKRGSFPPTLPRLAEIAPSEASEAEDDARGWDVVPEATEGKLQRVRPSSEAPVVYATRPKGVLDRTSQYLSTSPPISPDRVTLLDVDARDESFDSDEEDEEHFFRPLSYAGEADIMIPLPTEPVKSTLVYSPRGDRNFLSAPPRKLRKLWRREKRIKAREKQALWRLSISPQPSSGIPTIQSSPGTTPGATPRTTLEIRPDSRPFLSASSPLREDWIPEADDTRLTRSLLESENDTRRRGLSTGPKGRSTWSVSTPTAALNGGATTHSDVLSSTSASTRTFIVPLPPGLRPLTLIPTNAWCFVFGFIFPPLWWFGALYPITIRRRRRSRRPRVSVRSVLFFGRGGRRRGDDDDDDDVEGGKNGNETGGGGWLRVETSPTVAWAVAAGLIPVSTSAPERLPGPRVVSEWISAGSLATREGSSMSEPFWATQRGKLCFLLLLTYW
jgi:hypothetical protein